jgi:hypothetical protein
MDKYNYIVAHNVRQLVDQLNALNQIPEGCEQGEEWKPIGNPFKPGNVEMEDWYLLIERVF